MAFKNAVGEYAGTKPVSDEQVKQLGLTGEYVGSVHNKRTGKHQVVKMKIKHFADLPKVEEAEAAE